MKTKWVFTIQSSDRRPINAFLGEWTDRDDALQEARYLAEAHGVAMHVYSPYGILVHTEPAPTLQPIGSADLDMFDDDGEHSLSLTQNPWPGEV